MPKKLTSIRISEDILDKIELVKEIPGLKWKIQHQHERFSREYCLLNGTYSGQPSTADILELAMLEFFRKYNI